MNVTDLFYSGFVGLILIATLAGIMLVMIGVPLLVVKWVFLT